MRQKFYRFMADFHWKLYTIDAKINRVAWKVCDFMNYLKMRSISDRCVDIAHYWLMVRGEKNYAKYKNYRNIYWSMIEI